MKTTRFSFQLSTSFAGYSLKNKIRRKKRYPLVLMLEPLFRCNLKCSGCGRIRDSDVPDETLSVEECLCSAQESGAPIASITGGEPLMHPKFQEIIKGIIAQGRFVNLCTNGLLLETSSPLFIPSAHLSFAVHLDGLAKTHDSITGKERSVRDSNLRN